MTRKEAALRREIMRQVEALQRAAAEKKAAVTADFTSGSQCAKMEQASGSPESETAQHQADIRNF